MNITPLSSHPQGASFTASDDTHSADIWTTNTPVYRGQHIATIGNIRIDDSSHASAFLAQCADSLLRETNTHPPFKTVVAPMNGNTWLKHRLTLESDGRPPFLMEPNEPDHFLKTFQSAGFSILSKYSSSSIDLTTDLKNYSSLENRFFKNGIHIRPINLDTFEKDLTSIFKLSLTCFSNNFLYTPISQDTFVGKYMAARDLIDPDLVLLAERNDTLVAYVFCIPSPTSVIIKTLAALPERSLSGLGTVLVSKAQTIARTKGYPEAIHALQYENNSSLRISKRFNAHVFRRYALMAKFQS